MYIYIYMHVCILPTYVDTYAHTYIHIYIYTYMHTYTCISYIHKIEPKPPKLLMKSEKPSSPFEATGGLEEDDTPDSVTRQHIFRVLLYLHANIQHMLCIRASSEATEDQESQQARGDNRDDVSETHVCLEPCICFA